jgi:hypothetical protein
MGHDNHVIGWRQDPTPGREGERTPVFCNQYVAALEAALHDADKEALERVQSAFDDSINRDRRTEKNPDWS